jgi:hypothetical protein
MTLTLDEARAIGALEIRMEHVEAELKDHMLALAALTETLKQAADSLTSLGQALVDANIVKVKKRDEV